MNNVTVIIVLVLAISALIAMGLSYYLCEHEAEVIAVLKGGVLAYFSDTNEIVYVGNMPQRVPPSLGDVIKIKHPLKYNLKHKRAKEKLPTSQEIKSGTDCTFWAEELREGLEQAVLIRRITATKWLAQCQDDDIVLDLCDDDYKMGDKVVFLPLKWTLCRFYYV